MKIISKLKSKYDSYSHSITIAERETKKQSYYNDFARNVMPEEIIEYPHNLLINNSVLVHSRICGIPPIGTHHDGYPRNLKNHIIDILTNINVENAVVMLSKTLWPISRVDAGNTIQDAVVNNDMKSIWDKEDNNSKTPDLILKYSAIDLETNFKTHHHADQNMFDSVLIITIFARSAKDMRIARGKVQPILDSNLIMHENPVKEQMKAYMLAMGIPIPKNQTMAYRIQIFSKVASVLSPLRVQNDIMADDGLLFGDLVKTNKNLLINFEDLPAMHMFIFGSSGSGKTVGMLVWCMRAHDDLGYIIIYITDKADPKTNYRNIVKKYGDEGQIIDIGPGSDNINPMQIFYEADKTKSIFGYEQAYDRHKGLIKSMFDAWKTDGLTSRQEARLDMHIDDCYERKGILRSVPDTWPNDWPLMEDLIREFEAYESTDVSSQALFDLSYPIGPKGEMNYLNRPTTVDFDKTFMVIDMSNVPGSFKKAQNIIVMGIVGMKFSNNTNRLVLAVDEAGSLMRDPKITEDLLSINTKGRSADVGLWLGTQQPEDVIKAGVWDQMQNNMFVTALFGRKSTQKGIEVLAKHFSLDKETQREFAKCKIGEGFILVEDKVYHNKVILSPFEKQILLNPETEVQESVAVSKIHPEVYKLSIDHGIFFKDMIQGDPGQFLNEQGYEQRRNQDAIGRGRIYFLINSAIINENDMIGVQSIDHYFTVLRVACFLADHNIKVQVNHHTDVDIVAEIEGKQIAFEYEKAGSHSSKKIRDKNIEGLKKYDAVYFITESLNYEDIVKNIDEKFVVARGVQLRDLLEDMITANSESD